MGFHGMTGRKDSRVWVTLGQSYTTSGAQRGPSTTTHPPFPWISSRFDQVCRLSFVRLIPMIAADKNVWVSSNSDAVVLMVVLVVPAFWVPCSVWPKFSWLWSAGVFRHTSRQDLTDFRFRRQKDEPPRCVFV
jgi:hypothetical protein